MPSKIYLYSAILDEVAEKFNKELDAVPQNEVATVKMDTPGGWTSSGAAMMMRISEHEAGVNIDVEGDALSMGGMLLSVASHCTASDMSQIMLHKAAYPSWYEPTVAEQKSVNFTNQIFKEKLTEKIGHTPEGQSIINEVFESDVRNDVYLLAKEAKDIGLIDEIKKVEIRKSAIDINKQVSDLEAILKSRYQRQENRNKNKTNNKMDINELESKHPELYKQVFANGVDAGIKKEQSRVNTIIAYKDAGVDECLTMITSGDVIDEPKKAELQIKIMKKLTPDKFEEEGTGTEGNGTSTTEPSNPSQISAETQAEIDEIKQKQGLKK